MTIVVFCGSLTGWSKVRHGAHIFDQSTSYPLSLTKSELKFPLSRRRHLRRCRCQDQCRSTSCGYYSRSRAHTFDWSAHIYFHNNILSNYSLFFPHRGRGGWQRRTLCHGTPLLSLIAPIGKCSFLFLEKSFLGVYLPSSQIYEFHHRNGITNGNYGMWVGPPVALMNNGRAVSQCQAT